MSVRTVGLVDLKALRQHGRDAMAEHRGQADLYDEAPIPWRMVAVQVREHRDAVEQWAAWLDDPGCELPEDGHEWLELHDLEWNGQCIVTGEWVENDPTKGQEGRRA